MTLMTMVFGREKSFRLGESSFPTLEDFSLGLKNRTKYHYDGSIDTKTDQRGVVLTYGYTNERRPAFQSATLPTGGTLTVDNSVLSIGWGYDDVGRVNQVTSYATAGGSGTVANQVLYNFDGFGRKNAIYQNHSGTVDTGSTPSVQFQYDYAADGNNVVTNGGRLLTVTYPSTPNSPSNPRVLQYTYGGAGTATVDSVLGRVVSIGGTASGDTYVTYVYNGTGRPVQSQLQNGVTLDLFRGTSGTYAGLDRFGRTIDQYWYVVAGSTSVSVADIQYGYDLAGNRISHQDMVAGTASLDELYTYDGLNRLWSLNCGQLVSGTLSNPTAAEGWTLDALGNFTGYSQSSAAGTTTQSNNQFSLSNELTGFGTTVGTSWAPPAYDAASNMITMPQPNSPGNPFTAKYDAWNRLMQVSGTSTVAQYQYDGLNQRIVKQTYTGGSLSETRHFYYNDRWQVLEG
jgi:hypothetical protein